MKWNISTLEELRSVAQYVADNLVKDESHATLLTLEGDLGSGKTAFTKELAHILGVEEHVTSPTFVLAKEYELQNQVYRKLIHIDAYRLEKGEDLKTVGFAELLTQPENLVVLEWPERVEGELPEWRKNITILLKDDTREITYEE